MALMDIKLGSSEEVIGLTLGDIGIVDINITMLIKHSVKFKCKL